MKVCHITTAHNLFDARVFYHECCFLSKSGIDVTLIAQHERECTVNGVHIIPIQKVRNRWFRCLFSTREAFRKACTVDADIYHFHDPELLPTIVRCARKMHKIVVWDAHENYASTIAYYNYLGVKSISRLAGKIFELIEFSTCKRAGAAVIAVTNVAANRYRNLDLPILVLGNYCSLSDISYPASVKKSVPPLVITSGTLHENRGVYVIMQAMMRVRNVFPCHLAMWGKFSPPGLQDDLRSLWQNSGLINGLDLSGPYSWMHLVNELVPRAAIGCVWLNTDMQNHRDTWSTRLFEYWSHAIPVICSANTVSGKAVEEVGGGIVVNSNGVEGWVNALIALLDNPIMAKEMGLRGRKAVENIYNWDHDGKRLIHFYEELLSGFR
jgi:glycosyltransferase involved in cell wall biosynthesis